MVRVGLISDTHGLMRAEALQTLVGSDVIIHAGDVGKAEVLTALAEIAPVIAVRGNVDLGAFSEALPRSAIVEPGGLRVYVLHGIAELDLDPAKAGFQVVVFGHSHRPHRSQKDHVLFLNPGSAGPRRFQLPVSVGHIDIDQGRFEVRFTDLLSGKPLRI